MGWDGIWWSEDRRSDKPPSPRIINNNIKGRQAEKKERSISFRTRNLLETKIHRQIRISLPPAPPASLAWKFENIEREKRCSHPYVATTLPTTIIISRERTSKKGSQDMVDQGGSHSYKNVRERFQLHYVSVRFTYTSTPTPGVHSDRQIPCSWTAFARIPEWLR